MEFASQLLDDPLELARAALQGQLPVSALAIHRVRSNRAVQRRHEVIPVDRFLDEVVRAPAQGANREVVLAVPRDDDVWRFGLAHPYLGQDSVTVHPRLLV